VAGNAGSTNTGGSKPWATVAKLFAALVACGVLAAGVLLPYVGGLGLFAGHEAGKFLNTTCNLQESKPPQKTTMYARDGKTVIATLFSQDRVPIPLSDVPQYLQDALVATEDRRFFSHHGVDMKGLIRSAVSTSGGDTQGGSTLTMQYVKQVRYYEAGNDLKKQNAAIAQNLQRKMEDAKCAIYIERTEGKSKREILDDYLNIAFFGENSYGIQTAAETYFGVNAKDLTLPQSALLVGLLRAPTDYDPFLHPAASKERRNEVLQNLVAVKKLSQPDADKLKATPVSLATDNPPNIQQGCANSSSTIPNVAFFCDYAQNWLTTTGGISSTLLKTGGLKVITTLNPALQKSMQASISKQIPATSPMTAVMPAIDPKTGDVLAMATSKKFGSGKGETEQPVFTNYTANGASTYKLFPLLAALSTGIPTDWKLDTGADPNKDSYSTQNCATPGKVKNGDANEHYNRNETLATATAKSSNSYFVGLVDMGFSCYLQPVVDIAQKLGMNGLNRVADDNSKVPYAKEIIDLQRAQQLVLGSVPTSPLELAGAYAGVANDGYFNAPAPILSITDSDGNPIPVKRAPTVQAIAPQVAQQAIDVLEGDTHGDGTTAGEFSTLWYDKNGSPVAGKTGTAAAVTDTGKESSKNAAVWFVGMTPRLTAASALINFDAPFAPSTGLPGQAVGAPYGDYASRIWINALKGSLLHKSWTWTPSVTGTSVPNISNMSASDAKQALASYGFKYAEFDAADNVQCPSETAAYNQVAYYAPTIAPKGSTITVCLSTGSRQNYYKPPPPVVHSSSHSNSQSSSSSSSSSNSPSNGTSGSGSSSSGNRTGNGHGHGHGGAPPNH
jgi:membrane peptidoglycan carboxypeptidase